MTKRDSFLKRKHSWQITFILMSVVGFILLSLFIKGYGSYFSINVEAYNFFHTLRSNLITNLAILICLLGDKNVVIPTFGIICLWLFLQKQRRAAIYCFFSIALAVITTYVFKIWVASPRPGDMTFALENFSFPSGHVALICSYLIFLYALIAPQFPHSQRKIIAISFIILIAAQTFARLLLDAHWVTDIVAGFLIGTSSGLISVYGYYRKPTPINTKQLVAVAVLTFIICSCIYMTFFYKKMLNQYRIKNGVLRVIGHKII